MKPMESFFTMYFLLEACYCIFPEDDVEASLNLNAFLNCVGSPISDEKCPMSPSFYEDWLSQNNVTLLNDENIVDAVISFLKCYEKRGYNFGRTKELLRMWENPGMIKVAVRRAKLVCQQYHHED